MGDDRTIELANKWLDVSYLVREEEAKEIEVCGIRYVRAALRSDSPESEDNPDDRIARVDEQMAAEDYRSKVPPEGDWIDTDLGLEFIRRPASTGGERDEPRVGPDQSEAVEADRERGNDGL